MSTTLTVSRFAAGQTSLLGYADADAVAAPAPDAVGESGGDPRSLDDLIVDTWEGLVKGTSRCPVCGGRLEPEFGAHTRPVGGRCADCGSALH
jgi:hypothetical protein